jgi:Flp pilus assembly pilin Flp
MSRPFAFTGRKLKQKLSGRLPERYRRDDSGLTTLEWLLIVAAVAGLAALAVVLVTNVVSDTSEQISGQSARLTAAQVAAQTISDQHTAGELDDANAERRCNRLPVSYTDVGDNGINAAWNKNAANAAEKCTVTLKS